ncbi:chaperone [Lithospermum erythrorhizon]|uniref:Chaperone n=1 Tax=Lithospermum erythrorhizon TaxID=34254 RepID=A0AAV3NYH0_LITER
MRIPSLSTYPKKLVTFQKIQSLYRNPLKIQYLNQNPTKIYQFLHKFHLHPSNYIVFQQFSCEPLITQSDPHLINDICRVLSDFRSPHHDIESALHPFATNISPNYVEQVLKRCKNLGFSAHRFFIWAQNLPNFTHSKESYHILVDVLGSSKQFPLIWDFLAELKRCEFYEIESEIFWVVFRAYCRANLPNDAIRAYNKMVDFGIKSNIDDLDQLLYSLCKRGHVKHAQEFFDNVKDDYAVGAKSYNILIKGWGKIGEASEARRLFDEMLERGCLVDLLAYNSVLDCLCKGGNVDDAYKFFMKMKSMGIKPDAYTHSIFIHAACEANDIHSAFKILDRMRRYKLVPNVFTYNNMIKNLCKSDKVDDAYKLLREMIESGVAPDVWSYNAILAFHADRSEVNGALRLISRMDEESCKPDRHTYNMVLKMLIKVGRFDRVEEVWERMEKRGFYPTVSTYAVMIHGFLKKKGKVEEACKYFEMMIDEGLPPYVSTCEVFRNKLIGLGFASQADILAAKMERSTSCSIQELANVMKGNRTSVVSRREELSSGSEYSD